MNHDAFLANFNVTSKDVDKIKVAEEKCLNRLKENIEKKKNNPDLKIDLIDASYEITTLQSVFESKIKAFSEKVDKYIRDNNLENDELMEVYNAYNERVKWYKENTVDFLGKDINTVKGVYKNIEQGMGIDVDNIFVAEPKTSQFAPKKDEPAQNGPTNDEQNIDEDDTLDYNTTSLEDEKEANSIIAKLIEARRQLREVRKQLRQIKRDEFLKSAEELYVNSKNDKAKIKALKKEYKEILEEFDKEYEKQSKELQTRREDAETAQLLASDKLIKQEDKFRDFKKVAPLAIKYEKQDKEYQKEIDRLYDKIQNEDRPEKKKNIVEQRNKLKAARKSATDKFAETDTGKEYFKQMDLIYKERNNVRNAEKKVKNVETIQKNYEKLVEGQRKDLQKEFENKLPAKQAKQGFITKMIGAIKHRFGKDKEESVQESVLKRAIASIGELRKNTKNLVSEKWNRFTDISQSEILNMMKDHLDKRLAKANEQISARQTQSQEQNNEEPVL